MILQRPVGTRETRNVEADRKDGATSRGARVRFLLTGQHDDNNDDEDDEDDHDDEEEKEKDKDYEVAGGEARRRWRRRRRRRWWRWTRGEKRCSNSHSLANSPGHRTGWQVVPNCLKQVA